MSNKPGSTPVTTNRHNKEYRYFVCIGRHQRRTICEQKAVLIDQVQAEVARHYEVLEPPREVIRQLKEAVRREIGPMQQEGDEKMRVQRSRISALRSEQKKLLQAHYADAIPLDVLKSEQDRIRSQLQQAEAVVSMLDIEYEAVAANLDGAFEFATNWSRAYRAAGPAVRRKFNQALFDRLYVDDNGTITGHLHPTVARGNSRSPRRRR